MEIFVGQANLIVQARFGGWSSSTTLGVSFAASEAGFGVSFGPHANVMHRFRPKLASTEVSLLAGTDAF